MQHKHDISLFILQLKDGCSLKYFEYYEINVT